MLDKTPLFSSLTRPRLLVGVERWPLVGLLCLGFCTPLMVNTKALLLVTLPVCVALIFALKKVNRKDFQWSSVYRRSLDYQDFYPARPHLTGTTESALSKLMRKKPLG